MTLSDALTGILGAVTLTLPGWLVARKARLPQPLLAGFIAGVVGLVLLVLTCASLGVRLAPGPLAAGWSAVVALAAGLAWKSARPPHAAEPDASSHRVPPLLWLPLLPAAAVVLYRATTQPLFGVDTVFRWDYLATQMLARGTLDFYPPVSASDYAIYSWPDGIAPAVSSVYLWVYSLAGAARPTLTAPVVVLQVALLIAGVYALTRRHFSPRAGAFAAALAAGSPLLLWASAMGQETGLTALAAIGLLLYLPRSRAEETPAAIVFAGLAAGLGGLAREYGLVLPVLGFAIAAIRGLSPRGIVLFLGVSILACAPWHLRNWALTGNPLFNLSVSGLFPTNLVHDWLNASYHAELGWGRLPPEALRITLLNTVAALTAGALGGVLYARTVPAWVGIVLVFIALWAASVGYTAAGFTYSLRVLSPALALAAALGGAALARAVPAGRAQAWAVAGLTLLAVDSALRALVLPANVYRVPPAQWLTVGRALHEYHARPLYRELVRVAGNERLLVLGPNALLTSLGARTLPLWSPEVGFVFDPKLLPSEIARRLRAAEIGFVLLTQGEVNARFLARSSFFRDPAGALQPVWSDPDLVLLRVHAPSP
jgi:hypothetical protein